jgi:hypothetical protein
MIVMIQRSRLNSVFLTMHHFESTVHFGGLFGIRLMYGLEGIKK